MTRRTLERSIPERVLFEEKPEADLGLLYAIAVMIVFDDIVITLLMINLGAPELLVGVILALNAVLFALVYSFTRLRKVKLTDRRVIVRFGISRSSILIPNMRSVTVEDPPTWNRSGLVSGWRGRTVYCFKGSSPFVKIEYGTGKLRSVFFNVDRLPEFVAKLRKIRELQ
jgi:hypothetical protein